MARNRLKRAGVAVLAAALMAVGLALPAGAAPPSGPIAVPAPDPGSGSQDAEAAPANDNHANARILNVPGGQTTTGNTTQATVEAGEPQHDLDSPTDARRSVWFTWTAPSDDWVSFDTRGSSFDTVLAIYVGTTIGSSVRMADNDDDPYDQSGPVTSRVLFKPIAGTVYHIALDGYNEEAFGPYRFRVGPVAAPANNSFANAETLLGPDDQVAGYTIAATADPGQPTGAFLSSTSIWYEWTAPATGTFIFETDGSGVDTLLAAYIGTTVNGLGFVTGDDDSGPGTSSQITINAALGTTYQIAVSGFNGAAGLIELGWTTGSVSAPANDSFSNPEVLPGSVGSLTTGNVSATLQGGEPAHGPGSGSSVWFVYTAPATGLVTLNATGTLFGNILAVYTGTTLGGLTPVTRAFSWVKGANQVHFRATAGTTYRIAMAGLFAQSGLIKLVWQPAQATFSDVPTSSQFFGEIGWMNDNEITTGFANGTFRPAAGVTRAAMAAFMFRFFGEDIDDYTAPSPPTFSDVPANSPFYAEIEILVDRGVIGGFPGGTYRPGASVSRQAMSAFMYRLVGEPPYMAPTTATFSDVPVGSTFFEEIEWMAEEGITTGFGPGTFRPGAAVSRQAMSAFMQRLSLTLFPA